MTILSIKNERSREVDLENMTDEFASTKARDLTFFLLPQAPIYYGPVIVFVHLGFFALIFIFKKYDIKILFFLMTEFFGVPLNFALEVRASP